MVEPRILPPGGLTCLIETKRCSPKPRICLAAARRCSTDPCVQLLSGPARTGPDCLAYSPGSYLNEIARRTR